MQIPTLVSSHLKFRYSRYETGPNTLHLNKLPQVILFRWSEAMLKNTGIECLHLDPI